MGVESMGHHLGAVLCLSLASCTVLSEPAPFDSSTPQDGDPPGTGVPGSDGGPGVPGADDGGAPRASLHSGGSRLRAVHHETREGISVFTEYRDLQEGYTCSFGVAADGERRCLPRGAGVGYESSTRYYANPDCTRPIATYAGSPCDGPASLASSVDTSACPPRTRVYALGARVQGSTGYSRGPSGECLATGFSSNVSLHEIGEEIPPSRWVAARYETKPAVDGLARTDVVAEDGTRGFSTFVDEARGANCTFKTAADGVLRCLPTNTSAPSTVLFANDTCSAPAVVWKASACAGPTMAASSFADGCTTRTRVYELGAPSSLYSASSGCKPYDEASSYESRALGAEAPAASFASGSRELHGSGRLRAVELVTRGGEAYPSALEDTQLGQACSFGVAGDGALRCVPEAKASAFYFSDPGCSIRIASRTESPDCAIPEADLLAGVVDESACPPRTRVFRVGARITPASIYAQLGASCLSTSTASKTFYALGAEIPPSDLVPATAVER